MYFTIGPKVPSSSPLSPDAWHAYLTLLRQVRAVQDLSARVGSEARSAANAYHHALLTGGSDDWARLAESAAKVAAIGGEIASFAKLGEREREAIAFFEAIAKENADLVNAVNVAA
jgi:hypothetical protein